MPLFFVGSVAAQLPSDVRYKSGVWHIGDSPCLMYHPTNF